MANFVEGRYDKQTLTRHRLTIGVLAVLAYGAIFVGWLNTDWPGRNALGMAVIASCFLGGLWWMFASRKSGPVSLSPTSKDWMKRSFTQQRDPG